jgi:hypothetical protein
MSDAEVARIARLARERTLEEHTADRRAAELEAVIEDAAAGVTPGSTSRDMMIEAG